MVQGTRKFAKDHEGGLQKYIYIHMCVCVCVCALAETCHLMYSPEGAEMCKKKKSSSFKVLNLAVECMRYIPYVQYHD